jgi:hypothetical protein
MTFQTPDYLKLPVLIKISNVLLILSSCLPGTHRVLDTTGYSVALCIGDIKSTWFANSGARYDFLRKNIYE